MRPGILWQESFSVENIGFSEKAEFRVFELDLFYYSKLLLFHLKNYGTRTNPVNDFAVCIVHVSYHQQLKQFNFFRHIVHKLYS